MADLARLVVRLEAESLKFQKELDQAKRKLAGFESSASKSAKQIGAVLGAAAAAAAVGLGIMIKRSIDLADDMSKAAQKIGVTTESLSQLRYAADLAGVSSSALDKSLIRLNRSMSEAAITSTSKAAMAFKALGVNVENADGSLRASDDVLNDVSDRLAGMRDGATKTALAMDIFGKSGADLIPLMNGGAKAIAEARAEADLFGQTVEGKAAKQLEQFNDNMSRVSRLFSGVFLQAAQKIAPILEKITNEFVRQAKESGGVKRGVDTIVTGFRLLFSVGVGVRGVLSEVGILLGGLAATASQLDIAGSLKEFTPQGQFLQLIGVLDDKTDSIDSAASTLKQTFEDLRKEMENNDKLMAAVWDDTAAATDEVETKTTDSSAEIAKSLKGMGDAAKQAASEQASAMSTILGMVQNLQQQTATYEQGEGAVIRYRIAQGDLAATFATAGAGAATYKDQLIALTDQLEAQRAASELAAQKQEVFTNDITALQAELSETMSPLKAYEQTIAFINDLMAQGVISQKAYNEAVAQAGDAFANAEPPADEWAKTVDSVFENAARSMQSSLADFLFDPFADGLDGMLNGFVTMLRRMGAELLAAEAFKLLSESFGGMGGGSSTGGLITGLVGLFGGARENGGPVNGGTPFLVGERGPELFVPGSSGNIMNARETSGMGGTQVNMTVVTPDADSFRKSRRQVVNGVKLGFGV